MKEISNGILLFNIKYYIKMLEFRFFSFLSYQSYEKSRTEIKKARTEKSGIQSQGAWLFLAIDACTEMLFLCSLLGNKACGWTERRVLILYRFGQWNWISAWRSRKQSGKQGRGAVIICSSYWLPQCKKREEVFCFRDIIHTCYCSDDAI